MKGVGTPRLRGPDDTIVEHGGDVATPSSAIPPHALKDEFPIALEGSRRVRFRGVLDLDFPSTIHQPAGKAIIVISLGKWDIEKPFLVRKMIFEGFVLEDS